MIYPLWIIFCILERNNPKVMRLIYEKILAIPVKLNKNKYNLLLLCHI